MWMYDTKTGAPVEVPDEEVAKTFATGRASFKKGTRIPIIDRKGKNPGSVLVEDLDEALSAGWSVEPAVSRQARKDEKAHGGIGQEILTGVEGAASGATLGLSRSIAASTLDNAKQQEARARTNPIISTGSEIAGAVLPVLATAGEATPAVAARAAPGVARVARLLPTAAAERAGVGVARAAEAAGLPRFAARGVGGAVEGGIQSAGMQLSEDVLHEQPSSPDKFISSMGLGALVGGSTSGVLSLAGSVGNKALGFAAGAPVVTGAKPGTIDAAREAIEAQAEQDPTTFVGKIVSSVLGKDRAGAVRRYARDRGLRDLARTADSDANRLFIEGSEGVARMADDVGEAMDVGMRTVKRTEIDAGLAAVNAVPVRQRGFQMLTEIRAEVDRMAANPADFGGVSQIKDTLLQVKKMEKILGVKRTKDKITGAVSYSLDPKKTPTAKEMFDGWDQVRHNFDNIAHLGESASARERPAANVAKGLRKGIKLFLEDTGMFGSAAASQAKWNGIAREFIDAGDEFFESGMFGKRAGYVGGKPDFKVNPGSMEAFFKSLGEPGNELRKQSFLKFLAASKKVADEFQADAGLQTRLAGAFSKTAEMAKLAKAMATLRAVSGKVSGVEQAVQSTIGRHLFGAALGGVTGGPIGAILGAAAPLAGATVLHVLDQALSQRGAAIRGLSKVIARGKVVRDRAPYVATKILNEHRFSDRKYDRPARTKEEAYQRTAAEITALKADTKGRQETAAAKLEPLVDSAPQLAMGVLQAWDRAFDYLVQAMPKSPDVSPFASPGLKLSPPELEIDAFASVVRALGNPVSILEDLANGRLTLEGRDAVANVYPELFAEMRKEVARAIDEGGAEIEYEQRLQLAMFLMDDTLEPSLLPENIVACQSAYAPAEPPPTGPMKAGGATKSLKSIANAASAMDRLEGRGARSQDFAS